MKTLLEEYTELTTAAEKLINTAKEEGRDLSPEEYSENQTRFDRMEQIKKLSDADKRLADAKAVQLYSAPAKEEREQLAGGSVDRPPAKVQPDRSNRSTEGTEEYAAEAKALDHYIRTGETSFEEYTLTTSSGGGVLVPSTVLQPKVIRVVTNPILPALQARGLDAIRTDTTEPVTIPIIDDTANSAQVIPQNATTDNALDPDVSGSVKLYGDKIFDSGTVWVSDTLLRSNTWNLLDFIRPRLYERIERAQAGAWFTSLAAAANIYTTAANNAITYPDVNGWYFSLNAAYREDAAFFVSDGMLQTLTNMVDSQGRPMYRQSMRDGEPDTLLGKPIYVTTAPALAVPAAGATVGVFASLSCLFVRLVNDVDVLTYEKEPLKPKQTGVRVLQSGDFAFVPRGVSVLKYHA